MPVLVRPPVPVSAPDRVASTTAPPLTTSTARWAAPKLIGLAKVTLWVAVTSERRSEEPVGTKPPEPQLSTMPAEPRFTTRSALRA